MLEVIFGNKTTEKILFFFERHSSGYPKSIADNFSLPVFQVQRQLQRLETGGVVVSRLYGKVRIYQINPRYPFKKELHNLLSKAFDYLPEQEIKKYYTKRTRPRRPNKTL